MTIRNKKGILICFIGIDGSGKTTQAKALVETISKKYGIKANYVWGKFEPKLSKPFIAIANRLLFHGRDVHSDPAGYFRIKRRLFKNRLLFGVYHYLLLFDYFFQLLIKVRAPLTRGRVVICDRYIYDTVVDLAVDSEHPDKQAKTLLKRYSGLFPVPDVIFLIDLPEEIAYHRKRDIPSLNFLSERKGAYLSMSQQYGMVVLDGTQDLAKLNEIIQSKVVTLMAEP